MAKEFKVRNLQDSTYQVVELMPSNEDGPYLYEDESVVFQGNLADCEAYIRLTESGHM